MNQNRPDKSAISNRSNLSIIDPWIDQSSWH